MDTTTRLTLSIPVDSDSTQVHYYLDLWALVVFSGVVAVMVVVVMLVVTDVTVVHDTDERSKMSNFTLMTKNVTFASQVFEKKEEWGLAALLLHEHAKGNESRWYPFVRTLRMNMLRKSVLQELDGTFAAEL